jgi:PadR family transcriptional regulator, regulatory protein AphA
MSIQFALLGLLSWKPLSGYDLKKIISESAAFYWSGNNNQIYRTLVQMHADGLVTQETHYQESLPPRKVYSITGKGREELRDWLLCAPELPEVRNTFLTRLAWADLLADEELDGLLASYAEEVETALRMQQEKARRGRSAPERTPRERFLWEKIDENVIATYQNELDWVRGVRDGVINRTLTAVKTTTS